MVPPECPPGTRVWGAPGWPAPSTHSRAVGPRPATPECQDACPPPRSLDSGLPRVTLLALTPRPCHPLQWSVVGGHPGLSRWGQEQRPLSAQPLLSAPGQNPNSPPRTAEDAGAGSVDLGAPRPVDAPGSSSAGSWTGSQWGGLRQAGACEPQGGAEALTSAGSPLTRLLVTRCSGSCPRPALHPGAPPAGSHLTGPLQQPPFQPRSFPLDRRGRPPG